MASSAPRAAFERAPIASPRNPGMESPLLRARRRAEAAARDPNAGFASALSHLAEEEARIEAKAAETVAAVDRAVRRANASVTAPEEYSVLSEHTSLVDDDTPDDPSSELARRREEAPVPLGSPASANDPDAALFVAAVMAAAEVTADAREDHRGTAAAPDEGGDDASAPRGGGTLHGGTPDGTPDGSPDGTPRRAPSSARPGGPSPLALAALLVASLSAAWARTTSNSHAAGARRVALRTLRRAKRVVAARAEAARRGGLRRLRARFGGLPDPPPEAEAAASAESEAPEEDAVGDAPTKNGAADLLAGSDPEDPDEAVLEEASKIGRDLIRGLLPTPLALGGKSRPRWAEGDLSPAVAAPEEAAADESAASAAALGLGLGLGLDDAGDDSAGDDDDSAGDSAYSDDDRARSEDSDAERESDDAESDAYGDDDATESSPQISGVGPGMRFAPPAPESSPRVSGVGPGMRAYASPAAAAPAPFAPATEQEAAAALRQYQEFLQFQQFQQFQAMRRMQEEQRARDEAHAAAAHAAAEMNPPPSAANAAGMNPPPSAASAGPVARADRSRRASRGAPSGGSASRAASGGSSAAAAASRESRRSRRSAHGERVLRERRAEEEEFTSRTPRSEEKSKVKAEVRRIERRREMR